MGLTNTFIDIPSIHNNNSSFIDEIKLLRWGWTKQIIAIIMEICKLFIDGSVDPKSKVGYGAFLCVPHEKLFFESLKTSVKVKRFEQTSSTKLELQTLVWALTTIQEGGGKVIIFTDSQNIIGLPGRRRRFEQKNYRTKKNKRIKNFKLYQEFFKIVDQLCCKFIKVRGHKVSHQKDETDKFFTLVDKASRKALRNGKRIGCDR